MWKPCTPRKPYNAACGDCGITRDISGEMRRGLCPKHYEKRRYAGTLPPREPFPPKKPQVWQLVQNPEPGHDRHSLRRRDRRRQIAAARLARVGLPLAVEPGEMPLPKMPNNSRLWAGGGVAPLT